MLEQLNAVMTNSDEIEIKAVISLDALIMRQLEAEIITDVTVKPYDEEKNTGIARNCRLCSKAGRYFMENCKNFYSTVDSIKTINELKDDKIHPGDRLVLMKKVEEL